MERGYVILWWEPSKADKLFHPAMRSMEINITSKGYIWQGLLGEGAFATVLLCKRIQDEKLYAAKIMKFDCNRRLKWEAENEIEVTVVLHTTTTVRFYFWAWNSTSKPAFTVNLRLQSFGNPLKPSRRKLVIITCGYLNSKTQCCFFNIFCGGG